MKKRGPDGLFREIWTTRVDPDSPSANAADVAPAGKVWTVFENGPATEKVDILVIGETRDAATAARELAGRLAPLLVALLLLAGLVISALAASALARSKIRPQISSGSAVA